MGSPFTSRQVGNGSGGSGCLDFRADLDFPLEARTGLAEQPRQLDVAVAPGKFSAGTAGVAGVWQNEAAENSVRATRRNEGERNADRGLIVLRLLQKRAFAEPEVGRVRKSLPSNRPPTTSELFVW